jgi:hypothetical protein
MSNGMSQLIKGKNIDMNKVQFSDPNTLDNGAKLVYVNYNNSKFTVQTPWMDMPWEMKAFTDDKWPKYTITASFRGMDENPDLQAFHDRLVELEEKIIDAGTENSLAWFKKRDQPRQVTQALFNNIVKVSTDRDTGEPDGKYPPTMKLKVPFRDGKWQCRLFNANDGGESYRINDGTDSVEDVFVKNARVKCIIQCVGLWVAASSYMCQWKVVKAEVDVPETQENHSFLPDSDDEDGGAPPPRAKTSTPAMLDDSEEEEDDDGSPEASPEPAPVKKVAKRVRAPKKK